MRKFIHSLFLLALLCVPWFTQAQVYSFTCDFESDADTAAWTFTDNAVTNKWYIGEAANHGGTRGMYISNNNGVSNEYTTDSYSTSMAYHAVTLTEGVYEISYDWKVEGESNFDYLRVALVPSTVTLTGGTDVFPGVSTTGLPEGWIALDGGSKLNKSNTWNTFFTMQSIAAGSYNLVFYWRNDGSVGTNPPAAIDNVIFELPSCGAPVNVAVSNIVSDGATITWNTSTSASSWTVEYGLAGFTRGDGTIETANSNTHTITGLEGNTIYDIYVNAECASESSNSVKTSFRTACGEQQFPYRESFEDLNEGDFPMCWHKFAGVSSIVENSNWYPNTTDGTKSLELMNGAIVVSPYISLPGNQLAVDFLLTKDGPNSGKIQVGFTTDTSNLSNMTILRTIQPNNEDCNLYELELDTLSISEGGFLVWKQIDYSLGYWGDSDPYYLDAIFIRELSDCRRPALVTISQVQHNTARVSWTAIDGASNYEIMYGTIDDVDNPTNISVNTSSDFVDLYNLTPETTYYVWVRNNCGSENSDWRVGPQFTTTESCASVQSVEVLSTSVSGASIGWTLNTSIGEAATEVEVAYKASGDADYTIATTTNDYYIFTNLAASTTYEYRIRTICSSDTADAISGSFSTNVCGITIGGGNSSTSYAPAHCNYKYSYSQMLYPASQLAGVDSIKGLAFNVETVSPTTRTWDIYIGHVSRGTLSSSAPVPVDSMTLVGSGVQFNSHEGWAAVNLTTPFVYNGTSNLVVAIDDNTGSYNGSKYFKYHDGGITLYDYDDYTNHNPATFTSGFSELSGTPDIVFVSSCSSTACLAPLLAVNEVTSTTIELVWSGTGNESQWVVEYKLASDNTWTEAETTSGTTSMITELQPGSFYDVRVGAICGENTLYTTLNVFTACAAIEAPYSENFDVIDDLNPCWIAGNVDNNYEPYVSSNSLYMGYNGGGYVILPEFVEEVNTLRALFKIKNYDAGSRIAVGVGTDPNNWSTFVMIDTVVTIDGGVFEPQVCDFSSYVGSAHYIAFCDLDGASSIDDVVVEVAPLCAMPTSVSVSTITDEGATISWQGNSDGSEAWTIQYRNMATDEVSTVDAPSSDHSYTLSGLSADTEYEVMVYNICSGDSVAALRYIYFRTSCSEIVLPYQESFENKPVGEFPTCWSETTGFNNVVANTSYSINTTDGNNSLKIENGVVISPYIPVAGNTIALDFLLKRESYDAGKMEVGFSTSATDLSGMVVLSTINPTSNDIILYELDFDTISITDPGYIVWRQVDVSNYGYDKEFYLDGVYIRELSSCQRPAAVTISRVSHNSAYLDWDAVSSAATYDVMYGTSDDINNTNNITLTVSEDSVTLTSLRGETTYYAWVRTNCGGDYSDWRSAGNFTTQISCASIIDDEVNNITSTGAALSWSYEEGVGAPHTQVEVSWKSATETDYHTVITDNNYYIFSGLEVGVAYSYRLRTICDIDTALAVEGSFSTNPCGVAIRGDESTYTSIIPMGSNWKYAYSQMIYPASALAGIDTIHAIAFNAKSTGYGQTRNITVYLGHLASSTLPVGNPVPVSSLTTVATNLSFTWHEGWCTINFTDPFPYDGTSNLVIAIDDNTGDYHGIDEVYTHPGMSTYKRSDNTNYDPATVSSMQSISSVPDILFVEPCPDDICSAPILAVGNVTSTDVQLVWAATTPCQVEYKLSSVDAWTLHSTAVTDSFVTISNLQPGTFYDFRVSNECDGATLSSTASAFTDCAAITAPLIDNFTDYDINPCWTVGNLEENSLPYISSSSLYFGYYDGGYVVFPEFTNDIATLRTLFSMKSSNTAAQLEILAGTNPNDFTTFIPIDTLGITEAGEFQPQVCLFSNYTGTGHYIAFHSITNGIYIDNLIIEEAPSCSMPMDLAISNVTSDGATITWTGDNTMSSYWLIEYHEVGRDSIVAQMVYPSQGNTYDIVGLRSNTAYSVIVSNVCASGDTVEALAPISFRTACGVISLPYFENFEAEETYENHPCWFTTLDVFYDGTAHAPVIQSQNSNVMALTANCDVITPRVPIEGNRILINFDLKSESTFRSGNLIVGFSTSNTDLTNLVILDTIEPTNTEWVNYEYSLTSLTTTDTGYIVFKNVDNSPYQGGWSDTYYDLYLDNVNIMIDYGCPRVTDPSLSNLTTTSVDIAFTDLANTGSYSVGYSTYNDVNNMEMIVDFTTNPYTLNGLQSGTRYYAWVRANCALGGSPWVPLPSFVTPCVALAVPYFENFDSYLTDVSVSASAPENYPEHTLPSCWNFINMSDSRGTYPQAHLYCPTSSSHLSYADSANCLFLHSMTDSAMYIALPNFITPVSDLQIKFKYRNEGTSEYNGTLSLGVMSDITNTSTYINLEDFARTTDLTQARHIFSVDPQLVSGTNYVIVFRYQGGSSQNYYLSLDNVEVDLAPDCVLPSAVTVQSVSDVSATLNWHGNSASYNVQYRAVGTTTWSTTTSTTNSVTITGLTASTDYEAQVQSNCGSSVSEWSSIVTFTTSCGVQSIPYSQNFDSYTALVDDYIYVPDDYPNVAMPDCWAFPVRPDSDYPKIYMTASDSYADSGACLFFRSSHANYAYAVLPIFNTPVNQLRVQFKYRNESTYDANGFLSVGVMSNPMDTTTYTNLETYPRITTLTQSEHSFSIDNIPTGANYIAFRVGGGERDNYYVSIDNVVVDLAPTCPRLAAPTIVSTAAYTAELSWGGTSTSYQLGYKTADANAWTTVDVTANNYILTGLNAATDYEARVRAICSATDTSEWSNIVSFTTSCAPINLPYSEDFESCNGSIYNLNCWNLYGGLLSSIQAGTATLNAGASSYWTVSNSYPFAQSNYNASFNIYGSSRNGWLVTPEINLNTSASLVFDLGRHDFYDNNDWDSDDKFVVLISTDNEATWTILQTWQGTDYQNIPVCTDSAQVVSIDLSQYVGNNIRIAFYCETTVDSDADHYVHIDNITIGEGVTSSCPAPTNLVANNITQTSADLSWQGTAASYEVSYRTGNDAWTTATVATNTYALTNLEADEDYQWQVRSVCDGEYSAWISSTFTTLEEPECATPSDLTANVNATSVTLSWDAEEEQTSWEINLTTHTGVNDMIIVSTNPATIDNLIADIAYKASIRAICDEDVYSAWSDTISFTTGNCPEVSDIKIRATTAHTATIAWTAGGNETKWELMYGDMGFDVGEGITVESSTNPYTITDLQEGHYYDVYVRAMCGEDFYSLWSEHKSFLTSGSDESIDGVEGNFQFTIYPNPTSNATTISLNGVEGKVVISVVDMNGRTVANEAIECGVDCEKRIDVTNLAQGTYFVRVLGDNINSVRKLIVR